jgi:hypothetical protein
MALLGQWAVATNFSMILGPTLSEATSDQSGWETVAMRWCRYHQRFAGILALFALASGCLPPSRMFAPRAPFAPMIFRCQAQLHLGVSTDAPNSPAGGPHDDCAICLTVGCWAAR